MIPDLNKSILLLIYAWLFKEIYSSFSKRDIENRERIDSAIKAYANALSSINTDFKCNNPHLLWEAITYLPSNKAIEYKDCIINGDMIKIKEILTRQILNLKQMQYDKVSASNSFIDSIRAPFKRTPLPNILYTSIFFLIPLFMITQIQLNLKERFTTIDLTQEDQMVMILNYIIGLILGIANFIISVFALDNIPKHNKTPKNKIHIVGNVLTLLCNIILLCTFLTFLFTLMAIKIDSSLYFIINSICFMISVTLMTIFMVKKVYSDIRSEKANWKRFKNQFKLQK